MSIAESHYDVLGVDRAASADEIKKAWAKLIRIHTPDKDPEGNRRLNEAKTTLLDPGARQDYDSLLDYGDDIGDLLFQAQEAEEDENWSAAVDAYKEILAFHPTNHAARNRMALSQYNSGDLEGSRKSFELLIGRNDDVPVYWSNYGHVLMDLAHREEGEDDAVLSEKAREAFERASALEPYNAAHQIALSRYWRSKGEFAKAEEHVERAVSADGKVDMDDMEALFELPWIHLFSEQLDRIQEDADRIRSLVPPDMDDLLDYAAWRFFQMANDLSKHEHHIAAYKLLESGRKLQAEPEDLKPWAIGIEKNYRVQSQAEQLQNDTTLLEAAKGLGLLYTDYYFGHVEEKEADEVTAKLIDALNSWESHHIRVSVDRMQRYYPDIYEIHPDLFNRCRNLAGLQKSSYYREESSSSGMSGCTTYIIIALVIAAIRIAVAFFNNS